MKTQPDDSPKKLPILALIALGGLFATNAVNIDVPLVAIPDIANAYDVPAGAAQIITSVFFLGFGLAQIPLGLISDRVGRRPVLLAGLAVMLIGAVLAALAPRFELLVVARFVQGMATATTALLATAIIRDVSRGREAAAMMSFLAGTLAVMIFLVPILAGVVLWQIGWRAVLWLLVLYGIVFAGLAFRHVPETISEATRREAKENNFMGQVIDGLRAFFRAPASIAAALYTLFAFGGYFMFLIMGASLIVEYFGLAPSVFTPVFALIAFMQWLAAALNRKYVERIGVEKMMRCSAYLFVFAVILGIVLYTITAIPLWAFIVGSCYYAFCQGLVFPNAMAIALEPHPTRAGIASSVYGTINSLGAGLIGFIAGAVYDGRAQTMFLLSAVLSGIALLIYVFMGRHLTGRAAIVE